MIVKSLSKKVYDRDRFLEPEYSKGGLAGQTKSKKLKAIMGPLITEEQGKWLRFGRKSFRMRQFLPPRTLF
jgi:hypothetical protein